MTTARRLLLAVVLIAVITVISGVVQIAAPGVVLALMSTEATPTACHFFALIGMFMALFGGALLHALLARAAQPVVVLWAGLQKCGAVLGVALGVIYAVFAPFALLVALFDLVSAVLVLKYWRQMETPA